MQKNIWITLLLLALSIGFLCAAALRLRPIHMQRNADNLEVINPLEDEDISSELRLPIAALSTFRALAIDYLWILADRHKDEGQYFDAMHLARMIGQLQPNLESVWSYQAWNMAYNISVALPTGHERWDWVQNGFKLLRDEGLKYHPESLKLHRELAWIFQHKIGGISDDQHRYYKLMMALELGPVLTRLSDGQMNVNEDIAEMAAITSDWEELLQDEKTAALVQEMKDVEESFAEDEQLWEGLVQFRVDPTRFSPQLHQVLRDNRSNPALKKLDVYVRVRKLREQWKLEPARMLAINKKYGPLDFSESDTDTMVHLSLDWRLPFSHSIYWALKGLEYAGDDRSVDYNNLKRVVNQSLQDQYFYGKLIIPPREYFPDPGRERQKGQQILEVPEYMKELVFNTRDLRMFPVAYQASVDVVEGFLEEDPDDEPSGFIALSENLARTGITDLYLAGYERWSQKYLVHLRKRYPEDEAYQVRTIEEFVQTIIREEVKSNISPKKASNYINSLLFQSYRSYGMGDDENAYVNEELARQFFQEYKRAHPDADDPTYRMTFDMKELRWEALKEFLSAPYVVDAIKGSFLSRLKSKDPDLYERVIKAAQEAMNQQRPAEPMN